MAGPAMVGLVVAGHSRALAEAAVALAREMAGGEVPIEVAAGLDETTFGTDAVAIGEAIEAADRGAGVVVLMDLGSAVLSAELALDLLSDDDLRHRVVLTAAPLVEGLVVAAVAAAGGASATEVAGEAAAGLAGKQAHLGDVPPQAPAGPGPAAAVAVLSAAVIVRNPHGLHARPAASLVAAVRRFYARVEIRNRTTDSPWVSAASLSRVATLGVSSGHEIELRASGPQAQAALDEFLALADRNFNEVTAGPRQSEKPAVRNFNESAAETSTGSRGLPASPGIAVGPARQARPAVPDIPDDPSAGPDQERRRIDAAIRAVRAELGQIRAGASDDTAGIFDAHLLLLDDTDLLDDVRDRIDAGTAAPRAWATATDRVAAEFAALDDAYLRARAADVQAVADQVLRALLGPGEQPATPDGVLIAEDLTPAGAAALDPARVAGVLLASGSPSSHAAIIARTRGIPAVVGLGPKVLDIPDGTVVAFDGGTAEVVVDPPAAVLTAFQQSAGARTARRERAAARASEPAVTSDGIPVAVGANIGSVDDAHAAADAGADLAGLVRTEFLFLDREAAPSVEEQASVYRAIADALGGRRITLRTLDVGGDKPLRYAPGPVEANPFLGVRGLRLALAHPALLADQLLAMVRVARETPVSVMFPMVSTVAEVIEARRMLDEAIARTGGGDPAGLHVGIMVEVPAAALKAASFARFVDFVSIGSNDLTQYALAAERGNPALAALADGLDPGVLRLIDAICRGVGDGVTVALCGELGADETAVPLLTGLGVRELSVVPPAVPEVKEAVRGTSLYRAAGLASRALDQADGAAVRSLHSAGHRSRP